jgi:hypothetical protein
MNLRTPLMVLALVTLSACGKPQPPDPERRPDPQATAMRDAIAKPLEQAKAAQTAVDEAAKVQRAAIDAATDTPKQ